MFAEYTALEYTFLNINFKTMTTKYLLLLITLLFPLVSFSQFSSKHEVMTGISGLNGISNADLDGDGDQDIISYASGNGKISWFENLDGTGNFARPQIINDSLSQYYNFIADIDNDGDQDIAALVDGYELWWYENLDGQGDNWASHYIYTWTWTGSTLGVGRRSLFVTDINGDGNPDLISASAKGDLVAWFDNTDGAGSFSAPIVITTDVSGTDDLVPIDMDGDLDLDLVINEGFGGTILWFENLDGLANFGDPVTIATGIDLPDQLAVEDFDLDGDPDIITSTTNNDILWIENLGGSLNFSAPEIQYNSAGNEALTFFVSDFDGDGLRDLVVADYYGDEVFILQNAGGGNFLPEDVIMEHIPTQPNDVLAADFDGDGFSDLVCSTNLSNSILWRKNLAGEGGAGWGPISIIALFRYDIGEVIAEDMDQDGDLDLVVSFSDHNYMTVVWFEQIDLFQNFGPAHIMYHIPSYQGSNIIDIHLEDVDNDNDKDLLFSAGFTEDNGVHWVENLDGQGRFASSATQVVYFFQGDLMSIQTYDFDGNGFQDVLWVNPFYNIIGWSPNNGNGSFADHVVISSSFGSSNFNPIPMDMADMDGDGDMDVLAGSLTTDEIVWMENTDGLGQNWVQHDIGLLDLVEILEVHDFDGDGDMDVLASSGTYLAGDKVQLFINQGNGEAFISQTLHDDPALAYFLDMDNDQDRDVIISGEDYIGWLENLSEIGTFAGLEIWIPDLPGVLDPYRFFKADLDADGDSDLISDRVEWYLNLASESYRIAGKVFFDENENGIQDSLEYGLAQRALILEPTQINSWTTPTGEFFMPVHPGSYELTCQTVPNWHYTTDSIVTVTVTEDVDTVFVNFPAVPDNSIRDIDIYINSGPTRCGFEVPFWINYTNVGTHRLDGRVVYVLDDSVSVVSVDPLPDMVVGDTLLWDFENLTITESRQINLVLQMPGENAIGDWLYSMAEAAYTEEDSLVLVGQDVHHSQITCGYDPNDKLVQPLNSDQINYTLFGETLHYTVRFQNTGTDTAFNIRIVDYLDPDLDWTSFRVTAASHDYYVLLDQQSGEVEFFFDNILLPDSTTNQVGSHGFIQYDIQPEGNLPENTAITNEAFIYFDFNSPIQTNETDNVMVSQYPVATVLESPLCFEDTNGTIALSLPVDGSFQFVWETGDTTALLTELASGTYPVSIYDESGRLVAQETISLEQPAPITLDVMPAGSLENMPTGSASVEISGGTAPYSYAWIEMTTGAVQTTEMATDLAPGNYELIVTDAYNCMQTTTFEVDVISSLTEVSEERVSFKVFPNPATDKVQLQFQNLPDDDFVIMLLDCTGKTVMEKPLAGTIVLELADFSLGIYYILVKNEFTNTIVAYEKLLLSR